MLSSVLGASVVGCSAVACSVVSTPVFAVSEEDWADSFELLVTPSSVLVSSAAFASSCATPKINVAPTKIDAVPTVNFRIEYLLLILGKKSNLLFDFFFK